MDATVKLNKQGLRDLNYYGPKVKKTEGAAIVPALVEGHQPVEGASRPEPSAPAPAPATAPDDSTP
jgi:hypothetical protein